MGQERPTTPGERESFLPRPAKNWEWMKSFKEGGIKKKKIHLQEDKKGVSVKRKRTKGQETGGPRR